MTLDTERHEATPEDRHRHPYAARPVAGTHVWLTPPDLLAKLGRFDLDPCAAPEPRPWPTADRHITLPEDGLKANWHGRVWCNPPFGAHTATWLQHMSAHGNGIALVFARTDTSMFHDYVFGLADGILFLKGRPNFYTPDGKRAKGNSGGPICLVAYGAGNSVLLAGSSIPGKYFRN